MAKKKATSEPIIAEEPARPEEQFRLDQSDSAPASPRPIGPRATNAGVKTYGARSARDRRTGSTSPTRAPSSTRRRDSSRSSTPRGMRPDLVANMLENPTITITEGQLREEYSYVISDLRSMAILAVGLIVLLAILAEVLPK
ncbi:MAG TPA: hypothetical protein VHD90_16925 [Phototrophicaceae bacterium]|nr:hypothetical protein [Phototrophicaceae bacterium]